MAALREAGHDVTHNWTDHAEATLALGGEATLSDDEARECASECEAGIDHADVLVLLAPTFTAKGAWWEGGYARKAGKPIVVAHNQAAKRRQSVFTRTTTRLCTDAEIVDALREIGGGR